MLLHRREALGFLIIRRTSATHARSAATVDRAAPYFCSGLRDGQKAVPAAGLLRPPVSGCVWLAIRRR